MQTIVPDNAQHIGSRGEQQDSFCFSNPDDAPRLARNGLLAVVADGMGGMALGQEASRIACRVALEVYERPAPSVFAMLDAIVAEATQAVHRRADEAGLAGDVGTTLVAVAVHADALHWRSVGDSRLYLFRDGHLTRLTADHIHGRSLLRAVGQGTLDREDALADPEFGALTSFIGLPEVQEVDGNVRPFSLCTGDRVLLCSDGLYNALSEADIEACLRAAPQGEGAHALVQTALDAQRPNQDNVTVSLLDLPPLAASRTAPLLEETPTVVRPATPEASRRTPARIARWGSLVGALVVLAAFGLFASRWMPPLGERGGPDTPADSTAEADSTAQQTPPVVSDTSRAEDPGEASTPPDSTARPPAGGGEPGAEPADAPARLPEAAGPPRPAPERPERDEPAPNEEGDVPTEEAAPAPPSDSTRSEPLRDPPLPDSTGSST